MSIEKMLATRLRQIDSALKRTGYAGIVMDKEYQYTLSDAAAWLDGAHSTGYMSQDKLPDEVVSVVELHKAKNELRDITKKYDNLVERFRQREELNQKEIEQLKKCCTQRGQRMQIMYNVLKDLYEAVQTYTYGSLGYSEDAADELLTEARDWFNKNGVPK